MGNFLLVLLIILTVIITAIIFLPKEKQQGKLLLSFIINHIKIKGVIIMVELKATQKVTGTLAPVDAKGNPASVETGSVTVTSSDETVATVEVNPDNELEFTILATGKAGVAQVDYSADADLGEGVVTIAGFTAVEVQAGDAVGFAANFGTPVEQ